MYVALGGGVPPLVVVDPEKNKYSAKSLKKSNLVFLADFQGFLGILFIFNDEKRKEIIFSVRKSEKKTPAAR